MIKVLERHQIDYNRLKFRGEVELHKKEAILYDHNIR